MALSERGPLLDGGPDGSQKLANVYDHKRTVKKTDSMGREVVCVQHTHSL